MVIEKLKFFPEGKDEILEYVEVLLSNTLKNNYEKEKLLLHSIIYMMFCSPLPKEELTPHTVLYLLESTSKVDEDGSNLLEKMYTVASPKLTNSSIEDIFWYLSECDCYVDIIIRLISVFQFYDQYFDKPVISEDGKTFHFYPNHLKQEKYSMPEGVEFVNSYSFLNNPYLAMLKLPKTVRFISKSAILNLANLTSITVHKENPFFSSEYGVLYKSRPERTLFKYPSALKNTTFTISADVKRVAQFAFNSSNNLKEILFENNEIQLDNAAFVDCLHIENISVLSGQPINFNQEAFQGMYLAPIENEEDEDTDNENPNLPPKNPFTNEDVDENSKEGDELSSGINKKNEEENLKSAIETKGLVKKVKTTPSKIKAEFDNYIVGHEEAKKTLSVAVYSHLLRIRNKAFGISKSNILLSGPTGVGKTEFARAISRILDLPFVTIDATSITETGMKGNDPTDILKDLYYAADENLTRAQNGIIYIDEIDKLATFGENAHRESYSKAVQQGLLKIIEGGVIPVRIETPMQPVTINFDTSNVLFIAGGAFNGLLEEEKETSKQIGFNSDVIATSQKKTRVEAKDYIKYGMTQELMGRFPVLVRLNALTENEICRILSEPKNSVIKQYERLVKCIGPELVFEDSLLKKVASNAIKTGTGARGLKTVVENLLENVIYELPDKCNVKKVIIHEKMFDNEPAQYIYEEQGDPVVEEQDSVDVDTDIEVKPSAPTPSSSESFRV
jgi:ATP-dependent Clp protease ATP-binding subunit ClpX